MLYDFCIKAILNPEIYPERLEELIRNFLNLGIIESRNYIRISYGSFLYAGTNGISPFS